MSPYNDAPWLKETRGPSWVEQFDEFKHASYFALHHL